MTLFFTNGMSSYLSAKVQDGFVRRRLLDQVEWLRHQIKRNESKEDLMLLLENYNWVIANMNHDLRLSGQDCFRLLGGSDTQQQSQQK